MSECEYGREGPPLCPLLNHSLSIASIVADSASVIASQNGDCFGWFLHNSRPRTPQLFSPLLPTPMSPNALDAFVGGVRGRAGGRAGRARAGASQTQREIDGRSGSYPATSFDVPVLLHSNDRRSGYIT